MGEMELNYWYEGAKCGKVKNIKLNVSN